MSGFIDFIKDRLGNIIYPVTKEKAVYDDDNIRLDNKLNSIKDDFTGIAATQAMLDVSGSLLEKALTVVENTYCYFTTNASTTDLPENTSKWLYASGFILRRYANIKIVLYGYNSQDVAYNYYAQNNGWIGWAKSLSTVDVINNDTTGGTDKVFSAEAGKTLGQEIDALNIKLNGTVSIGNTVANTPTTIPRTILYRHIYMLSFTSTNQDYSGMYFVIRADSNTINLISVKIPAKISVTTNSTGIIVNSQDYSIPYTLTDVTGFMN